MSSLTRRATLAFLSLACTAGRAGAVAAPPRPLPLIPPARLDALRRQPERWAALRRRCEAELGWQARPVDELSPGPRYTAAGVQEDAQTAAFSLDGRVAYRAGLCYLLSGEARYAAHAQTLVGAWAGSLRRVGNAQGKALINFHLPQYVLAASWTRDAGDSDGGPLKTLLREVAAPNSASAGKTNHADWGILLDAASAAYLGDAAALQAAQTRWRALVLEQVAEDGSLPTEISRSATSNWHGGPDKGIKGMAYTHYALLPLSMAGELLASQGLDVFDGAPGAALGRAFARAAAWTRHPETFPYYASNGGQLHDLRNAAYFALLQQRFPNADAAALLAEGGLGSDPQELTLLFAATP